MALGQQVARIAGGVVGGCVAWALAATILNLALRHSWLDYAAVEKQMDFTLLMMIARLIVGALASVAAGLAAAWISRRNPIAAWILIAIMLASFIPVHISLWARFPAWYHLIFFASLAFLPLVGLMRKAAR